MKTEQVLALPSALLSGIPSSGFTILQSRFWPFFQSAHFVFLDRAAADKNEEYRQVIPYVVATKIVEGCKYALAYERGTAGGENRLYHKVSIGLGGHIGTGDIRAHAAREVNEEVSGLQDYLDGLNCIGLISVNTKPVDRVHLGVVYELPVDSFIEPATAEHGEITKLGWKSRRELIDLHSVGYELETWSDLLVRQWLI